MGNAKWNSDKCSYCGKRLKTKDPFLGKYWCSNCKLWFVEYPVLQKESTAYLDSLTFILEKILERGGDRSFENSIVMEVGTGLFPWWLLAYTFINSSEIICLEKSKKLYETRELVKTALIGNNVRKYIDKIEFLIADARCCPLRNVFDIIFCHRFISSEIPFSALEEIKDIINRLISLLRPKTSIRRAGQLVIMEHSNKPRNEAQRNYLDWWKLRNKIWKMRLEEPWPILPMKNLQCFVRDFRTKKYVVDFRIELDENILSTEQFNKKLEQIEEDCRKYGLRVLENAGIKAHLLNKAKNDLRNLNAKIKKFGVQLPPYNILVITK